MQEMSPSYNILYIVLNIGPSFCVLGCPHRLGLYHILGHKTYILYIGPISILYNIHIYIYMYICSIYIYDIIYIII